VYTLGSSADLDHVLRDPAAVGAELVHPDRGGDVTYHGPGQLVGYPIVSLAEWRAGQRDVVAYVRRLESVLIAVLADFGIAATAEARYTGVWVGDEKVAAIGVRVARGRTRHGFALNVDPDLTMFDHIVPCGIRDRGVTSMARMLGEAPPMRAVVDRVVARFAEAFDTTSVERQDVAWRVGADDLAPFTRAASGDEPVRLLGRLAEAGVEQRVDPAQRRPEWMKVRARFDDEYLELKKLVRGLDLHTVCEEAGCPNIYECWADRTATFMILGDRCTRACGFCLVDTRKPLPVDLDEPRRVAEAVCTLGLAHVVVTCVARDDLPDGGAFVFAAVVDQVRAASPNTAVELLISDMKGDAASLATIFDARPDVLNHNLETVARLQRAARPSAGYARSLAVLARAKDAGLVTKSGLILGMGETADEVRAALADLRSVGVDIVTLGQYLRPTAQHLPIARWWTPAEFDAVRTDAEAMGFAHVEAGPLVRSSYHAREANDRQVGVAVGTAPTAG
jgi:lipoic acid synthetase